jgi:hypothetical protein
LEPVADHGIEGESADWNQIDERLPVDQFHDDEGLAAVVLDLVHRADAWMVERRGRPRLMQDLSVTVFARDCMEELDGDVAAKLLVVGAKHRAHAAGAERRGDTIPSDVMRGLLVHVLRATNNPAIVSKRGTCSIVD